MYAATKYRKHRINLSRVMQSSLIEDEIHFLRCRLPLDFCRGLTDPLGDLADL